MDVPAFAGPKFVPVRTMSAPPVVAVPSASAAAPDNVETVGLAYLVVLLVNTPEPCPPTVTLHIKPLPTPGMVLHLISVCEELTAQLVAVYLFGEPLGP